MSIAAPSSLSLTQKKRLWDQYKYDTFQQISQDKSTLFNYFLSNNDIFKLISPKDQRNFRIMEVKAEAEKSTAFFGAMAAVFFIDQVVFRFAFPKFKPWKHRLTTNVFKYLLIPSLVFAVYKQYYMNDYIVFFYKMQEKYSFGFEEYMKANRIFERALNVDRLEELREKRDEFNWDGIPELPETTDKK